MKAFIIQCGSVMPQGWAARWDGQEGVPRLVPRTPVLMLQGVVVNQLHAYRELGKRSGVAGDVVERRSHVNLWGMVDENG